MMDRSNIMQATTSMAWIDAVLASEGCRKISKG